MDVIYYRMHKEMWAAHVTEGRFFGIRWCLISTLKYSHLMVRFWGGIYIWDKYVYIEEGDQAQAPAQHEVVLPEEG